MATPKSTRIVVTTGGTRKSRKPAVVERQRRREVSPDSLVNASTDLFMREMCANSPARFYVGEEARLYYGDWERWDLVTVVLGYGAHCVRGLSGALERRLGYVVLDRSSDNIYFALAPFLRRDDGKPSHIRLVESRGQDAEDRHVRA